ncbi:putative nuclease HARBI1 [Sphaeramia orbicularis]|uniref:putative nuclease HARBI1 n=1 Tax=Sphaeramia orbicularis TaxID=375764 RepID=UPI0011812809|nr:putative nuclease HARBI1 [Sphaeramia orbicularis]
MTALALLEDTANGAVRRERVFRDREDFLAQDDEWLISHFRFPRAILLELCAELQPFLERDTARNHVLPEHIQVLTTLSFLATGSFQRELAARSGLCQSTLSQAMPAVWDGIIQISPKYIKFPHTAGDQANTEAEFAVRACFPNVIRAIDCTHIAIKAPSQDEIVYGNRKQFHSINVQNICDACMQLSNIVARWPGSTNDSLILTNSFVGNSLQAGMVPDGWLLGDCGYPLKTWLMTPLTNPQTDQERRYNDVHSRTQSVVERTIGMQKGRWRCLDLTRGVLLYRPEKVCHIVTFSTMWHTGTPSHCQSSTSPHQTNQTLDPSIPILPRRPFRPSNM